MSWQFRMLKAGWRTDKKRPGAWVYHKRILGNQLTIPAFMAQVWERLDKIPLGGK